MKATFFGFVTLFSLLLGAYPYHAEARHHRCSRTQVTVGATVCPQAPVYVVDRPYCYRPAPVMVYPEPYPYYSAAPVYVVPRPIVRERVYVAAPQPAFSFSWNFWR